MKKLNLFIGIDIGGTKISAGLVNDKGRILLRTKRPTPHHCRSKKMITLIRELCEEVSCYKGKCVMRRIRGIGIGVPGTIDTDLSTVLRTPNISLNHFPLGRRLQTLFKKKVLIGNDVNLALLGEKWLGAGRKTKTIVGIWPGTGIGGGIILNNHLYLGHNGLAAEIGHMIMESQGPLCSCGNHGCLEAIAGRWAIERDIRQAVRRGTKTVITKLTNGALSPIKSRVLKKALKKKDALTWRVMRRMAQALGRACISIRHILNPELIILGGGIMEACGKFLLPVVRRVSRSDPFFAQSDSCPIVLSQLGDDAVILGAVALLKEHLSRKSS